MDGQEESQQARQRHEKTNIRNYETREIHEKFTAFLVILTD